MMIFEKTKALLTMKCMSALFLIFMLYQGIHIIQKIDSEFEFEEQTQIDICSNYYLFHVFAFVLGAFWNVKKLLKVGIV
jgi:hypothetical protein